MDKNEHTLCSVPKRFLEELGAEPANVLSKLCFLQSKATTERAGKKWFSCPMGRYSAGKAKQKWYRPLEDHFPWLSPQQLHKIIVSPSKGGKRRDTSLEKSGRVEVARDANTDNWNKTLWFNVPEKIMKQWRYKKNRFFYYKKDVELLGDVARAIVLNILKREFALLASGDDVKYLSINRNAIARETGLPLSTVSDIIKDFVEGKIKVLATYDDGKKTTKTHAKGYRLLVPNQCTVKGRGEGRKKVSAVVAFECRSASNPCPMVIPRFPDNGLHELVARANAQMEQRSKVKPKKVRIRRRGKKLVDSRLSDIDLRGSYTKRNRSYWKVTDDADYEEEKRENKEVRYRKSALSS